MADSDSVYLFSDKLKLDATKELTLEDIALHRFNAVQGCYEVVRDPLLSSEAASVLDPVGNSEYAVEMKYGKPVPMRRCKSKHHRGRRDIPAAEFDGDEDKCRHCARLEHWLRTHSDRRDGVEVLAKARTGWKRLRTARGNSFR